MANLTTIASRLAELETLAQGYPYRDKRMGLGLFRERLENASLNIAVMGEFSAGKSYFINAILGIKGLLPTAVLPTTSVITRCFNSEEQPTAHFPDGRNVQLSMEETQELLKEGLYRGIPVDVVDMPLLTEWLPERINIIDTPGIGSLNERHRQLTLDFLPRVDLVLYLFNQALGSKDLEFLQRTGEMNQHIIFVMTQRDLINTSETSVEALLQKNIAVLSQHTRLEMPKLFVVSAKDYLNGGCRGMEAVKDYPIIHVLSDWEDVFAASQATKLERYIGDWLDEIKLLQNLKANETTAATEELLPIRANLEQELKQAQISARELLQHMQGQVKKLEQALTQSMVLDQEKQWSELHRQLSTAKDHRSLDPLRWESKLEQMMEERLAHWRKVTEEKGDSLLGFAGEIIDQRQAEFKQTLRSNFDVNWKVELPDTSVQELVTWEETQELERFRHQLTTFQQNREKILSQLGYKEEEVKELAAELKAFHQELQGLISEGINVTYQPQYIEQELEPDSGWADGLATVGNLVDWAMLFLPNPGPKAKQLFKLSGKLNKLGKAGQVLQKINKNKKLIDTVRSVQKVNKFKQQAHLASQAMPEHPAKNLVWEALDLLSAEGLLRRAGQLMDGDSLQRSILVEDPESRRMYDEALEQQRVKLQSGISQLGQREVEWRKASHQQQQLLAELGGC